MRPIIYFLLSFLFSASIAFLVSCTDKCESTSTFYKWEPVYLTMDEVIDSVKTESPITLENPGKIYYKDNYIYINEVKKGVHVIDNTDPSSPKNIAFIRIPGNYDIAIRNNTLYADSYVDLLAIDITNPENITIKNRVKEVFPAGFGAGGYYYEKEKGLITTYESRMVTEEGDCNDRPVMGRGWYEFMSDNSLRATSASPITTSGKAGSMARFALYKNFLYTVSNTDLQLFEITNPETPQTGNKLTLGWGVETIWPHKDKLFLGTTTGMLIYDNKNPATPEYISTFTHARSCDPVIVDDNYAYVTLRSGNACNGFTNQLDVVDIRDLTKPSLVKSYPMDNPHGLGKDNNVLFICDGASGLKVFNAEDVLKIDENQLAHYKAINTFDVIPLNGTLLMIGSDGLYQYDYSDLKNIKQLSKIPVVSKE